MATVASKVSGTIPSTSRGAYNCDFGAGGVGKSLFVNKYISPHGVDTYDPTLDESYRKIQKVDDEDALLDLLDTAGEQEFTAMRDLYIKSGNGFILQYSIAAKSSVDRIKVLWEQIVAGKKSKNVPVVLIGNKCDLPDTEREVSHEEGDQLAKEIQCPFFETSAKTSVNVEEAFVELVRMIRKINLEVEEAKKRETLKQRMLEEEEAQKKDDDENAKCCSGCVVV